MANGRRSRRGDVDPLDKKKVSKEGLKEILGIFKYVLPYRVYFIFGLLFLLLSTGASLTFPYFLGELVDAASPVPVTQLEELSRTDSILEQIPTDDINFTALILAAILAIQAIFSFLRIYLFAQVSERAMADIRLDLYRKIITLPIAFFEQRRVGELNSRISADVSQLQSILSITLAEFLRQILTLVVGITIMVVVISSKLTLFMIATFPVIIIAALVFGRYIRKLSKKTQDQLAESNTIVEETFQSISIVKAFANEWLESIKYKTALGKVVHTALRTAVFRGAFASFIIVAIFGAIILVIWFGALMINSGEIKVGELVSFMLYTTFIGGSVAGMGDLYAQLQKTIGASERVRELLKEEGEFDIESAQHATGERLEGNIAFEGVSFFYPSRKDVEVLQNVSFEIPAGQKVALVGHSGAGKSTIAQLILRFYEIEKGQLLVDGHPISTYDFQKLRQNIGVVPQEVILFGGTIKENIAYGNPEATEAEIIEAARKANAWEFIEGFPEQLETVVGERGIKLSGGQRQRIAIARAILKNPAILVLDEATSSLDAASEHLVQSALNKLMENRTTIIIAHRLSTIRQVDCIYVLEKGVITESGTHEALSVQQDGTYSKLLRLQLESGQV